ncbi:toll/interleukin-1 receptor domain-containing protein (plasmid) [Rhizobium leguminosarum]
MQEAFSGNVRVEGTDSAVSRVFLCHNNSDKAIVREVAEGLELEYGIPNFLDVYSIPAGVEFMPFLEKELSGCSCCAIFLGGKGWGPTHLWEAEQAVARFKKDPRFKLIPVMLPGIQDVDVDKFASGGVFRTLNCVDFRNIPIEPDSLRKLFLALTGSSDEDVSRRGLSPFILRRDASRWRERGRKDKSLLYSGAKLIEAQNMLETAGELLGVGEVAAFIRAGADRQRRFWQTVVAATSIAAFSLFVAAIFAVYQAWLAHDRQLLAVSRGLALEADSARGVGEQLLIAAHAVQIAGTSTARTKLLDKINTWRALAATAQMRDHEFTAAAYRADHRSVLLGTADGALLEAPIEFGQVEGEEVRFGSVKALLRAPGEGELVSIVTQREGLTLIGFQSGRVDVLGLNGERRLMRSAPAPKISETGSMRDRAVRAMAIAPSGDQVAIGDARGVIEIHDIESSELSFPALDMSHQLRINAIAFLGSDRIAVGTGIGNIEIFDSRNGQSIASLPKQGSEVVNISRGRDDNRVVEVTGSGMVRSIQLDVGQRALLTDPTGPMFQAPPMLITSAIDAVSGALALAYPDGIIEVRDSFGGNLLDRMQPHRDQVGAFVFLPGVRLLISAGRDGVIAAWRLDGQISIATPISHFAQGFVDMISADSENGVFIVSKNDDRAGIWQLLPTGWVQVLNLLEMSKQSLGDEELMPRRSADAEGFVDVSSQPIENVALAVDARAVIWTTHNGSVFSGSWSPVNAPTKHFKAQETIAAIAISENGRQAAVLEGSRKIALFTPSSSQGQNLREIFLDSDARSIGLSNDAQKLAVGLKNGEIRLYFLGQPDRPPIGRSIINVEIASVAFTPVGQTLVARGATVGKDPRTLATISTSDLADIHYLPMPDVLVGATTSLVISRDGKLLAAPDAGGNVLLWDLTERKSIGTSFLDGSAISALALDRDGAVIAAVSTGDNIVRLATSSGALIKRACRLANKDLGEAEWADLETGLAYNPICRRTDTSAP